MQVHELTNSSGTVAVASRPIKAGELVLAAEPFVCLPNYENIISGNYCVGCLAPTSTSTSPPTAFICPSCNVCTFCSSECYNTHYKVQHLASGECKIAQALVKSHHNLKGPNADSLLFLCAMLTRAEAELKILAGSNNNNNINNVNSTLLPQESVQLDNSNKSNSTATSSAISTPTSSSTPNFRILPTSLMQAKQQTPETNNNNNKMDESKTIPSGATSLKQHQLAERIAAKKNSKKSNKNDDDEEEEEEESDDDNSFYHQQQTKRNSNKKGSSKSNQKKQNKKKNNKNLSKFAQQQLQQPLQAIPEQNQSKSQQGESATTPAAPVASSLLPSRVIADIKQCQEATRTCLLKEFPALFASSSNISDDRIAASMKQLQWTLPSTASCARHQQTKLRSTSASSKLQPRENDIANLTTTSVTTDAVKFLNSVIKEDAENRRRIFAPSTASQQKNTVEDKTGTTPTFVNGFARLISNLKVSEKQPSYLSTVETLRRKFNNIYASAFSSPQNIDRNFFYHAYSAFCCNSFGVYRHHDDTQYAIGMYPIASYFNHSCLPNLVRRMDLGKVAYFYALRDVAAGEPLTIGYCDDVSTPNAQTRRLNLLESYRFWCECELCVVRDNSKTRNPRCSECQSKGLLRPVVVVNVARSNNSSDDDDGSCSTSARNLVGKECHSCFTLFPEEQK